MKKTRLAHLIALALAAQAQAQTTPMQTTSLKEITVTATRVEADTTSVPATITTLDRKALDQRAPRDEADLFRDEPDVALARDARRFGATRVNIRGIEDNRVLQLVDGVRLPNFYNGGGPTNFTLSGPLPVMADFMKRVEIVRGPASSLYGSDAIGGVVGYLTLDPADLLAPGQRSAYRYRLGYFGANQGLSNTALAAFRGEAVEGLIGVSRLSAQETRNQGEVDSIAANRTRANPQDSTDHGLLAKLIVRPAKGHQLGLTLEGREQNTRTDVRRLSSALPKVSSMQGDDHSRRIRASLNWEHRAATGVYDRLSATLHQQDSQTENLNVQRRSNTSASCSAVASGANHCRIEQDFFFAQRSAGLGVQIEKVLDTGTLAHFLTWGADLSRVRTEQMRDARVWLNNATAATKSLAGDTFPLRDFAIGQTDSVGLFVQNEISGLAGGQLTLTPALRYDQRKLQPKVDALAQAVLTSIGRQAVAQNDGAFSPKLAALWRLTPGLSAWGHVAGGFRAPNYEEVNGNFRNSAQSYGISPNPDLKPETSVGAELGLRASGTTLRWQVSVFDNRYQDFISSERLACPGDPSCISGLGTTFMARNLRRVKVRGAEARGAWDLAPGWRLDGAMAYATGTDPSTSQPIDSIEPTRFSLGLARDAGSWGAQARLRGAASKNRVNDFSGASYSPWFRPAGYAGADVSAWWQLHQKLRLTASVNNLFDKQYWLWSDIRQADARKPDGVDFYSQPGRNVNLALQADF
ncbi:TonB-dependent hemoglobin/transferrin/lactoferrin family receptor [Rhodoferax sp.]|uniref:TonB-dependent hemoglobin/transferrin/lactoferrin family receptor n=1 Tax=Rhodoferax sp. TaxID=50421 RepID=UPI0027543E07|nr:TonB-dependent hemoglobin/transferrin/lactoferrin family receptor [Rhodoferax sp.]